MRRGVASPLWLLAALTGAAWGQDTALAPSPALECMTPSTEARNRLQYPPEMLERRDEGTIEVELTFKAADEPPQTRFIDPDDQAFDGLKDAVRKHVRGFRVPCLAAGSPPVKMRQTYVFVANDGRKAVASEPVDESTQHRRALGACLTHVNQRPRPEYPTYARRFDEQGPVVVTITFTRPDGPPELKVLAAAAKSLQKAVTEHIEGLRLPCYDGQPVTFSQIYQFKLDGAARTLIADTTLARLLASAKQPLEPVYFDFGTMGCPFDLRIHYTRPHLRNGVMQLDNAHPERQPLMDWLSRLTLNLNDKTNTAVVGDWFTVHVPCGTLDL
jgi:hypothetical protein